MLPERSGLLPVVACHPAETCVQRHMVVLNTVARLVDKTQLSCVQAICCVKGLACHLVWRPDTDQRPKTGGIRYMQNVCVHSHVNLCVVRKHNKVACICHHLVSRFLGVSSYRNTISESAIRSRSVCWRAAYLNELINITNGWDIFWDEWLQGCV